MLLFFGMVYLTAANLLYKNVKDKINPQKFIYLIKSIIKNTNKYLNYKPIFNSIFIFTFACRNKSSWLTRAFVKIKRTGSA